MDPSEREAWRRADELLAQLLELPPERRSAALASAAVDPQVRARAAELVAAAERGAGPLDTPIDLASAAGAADAEAPAPPDLSGRRFGAYRLEEEIGRGGMAVVYRAVRVDGAFEQDVAVKILGTGLLPTSAAARFRREQELLARLRHPRIATLLDGGVAEDGTPYLVMERVAGRPIDRYCDEAGLDARARVELVRRVCDAVAFAHRNLVVHRDLKPGNVLATEGGEVKLLDFGIAKLLEPDTGLAEPTRARSRMLTPGYAAPEQMDGGAVTTATDVFGLGRVLERLLEGRPVDRDLANIRARALRAEPERRYADARALGEDLERWLAGRPVAATPDGWLYRLRKGVARHRFGVAAAAALAAVAAAGLVATLTKAAEVRQAERQATAVSEFLLGLFRASDPAENRGREVSVRELLDRGVEQARAVEDEPALRGRLLEVLGGVFHGLGRYERAAELWREAIDGLSRAGDDDRARLERLASLRDDLGVALVELDRLDEAGSVLDRALAERRRLFGDAHPEVAESLYHRGILAQHRGDFEAAEPDFRAALAVLRGDGSATEVDVADTLNHLGTTLRHLGRFEEAETSLREALAVRRARVAGDHPDVAHDLNGLATVLERRGRLDEALALLRETLSMRRRLYDESHPLVAQTLNDLAVSLEHRGELAAAADVYREALGSYRAQFGNDHQAVVIVANNLGRALFVAGRAAEAEPIFRDVLATLDRMPDASERNRAIALVGLGSALREGGRAAEGETVLRRALALARESIPDPAFTAMAELEVGRARLESGDASGAESLLAAAERSYREQYGAEHVRSARAAMWLGVCRARLGRRAEAESLLRAALAVQEAKLPPNHPNLVATRAELARLADAGGPAAAR